MQILPIKELKNGAKISELCHASSAPIHITKNGYADMVIMSAEAFEDLSAAAQANETAALIEEGINSIKRGECRDAFQALNVLRQKYAL